MRRKCFSSEIHQKILEAGGATFEMPIQKETMREMMEKLELKNVERLGFKTENVEGKRKLIIKAYDTDGALRVLEKVFHDSKTTIITQKSE